MKYLYLTVDDDCKYAFFSSDNAIFNIDIKNKRYPLFLYNIHLRGNTLIIKSETNFIFENKKYIKTNIKSNYSYPMYELVENSLKRRINLTKK